MSILDWLTGGAGRSGDERVGDTTTVRRIVRRLGEMEPRRARFVAAFAYVLGRVAYADRDFSEEERGRMEEIVREVGELPEEQAVLVVEIARAQNELFGGTENFLVTRELAEVATAEERAHLLDCLFAVSAADASITGAEETQVRQIASELGFSHREVVEARKAYARHREVLRGLEGRGGSGG